MLGQLCFVTGPLITERLSIDILYLIRTYALCASHTFTFVLETIPSTRDILFNVLLFSSLQLYVRSSLFIIFLENFVFRNFKQTHPNLTTFLCKILSNM